MNRNIALSLAFALAGAGTAHADEITADPPFTSTLSRAEVMADLMEYRRSGVNLLADDYNPLAQFRGSKTRADVRAEYLADRAAVAAFTGEDSGSFYMTHGKPAQVRETQRAVVIVEETQLAAVDGEEGLAH